MTALDARYMAEHCLGLDRSQRPPTAISPLYENVPRNLSKARTGPDNIARPKLKASIPSGLQDTLLFLICGYDFIYYPSDQKFSGIQSVFVRPSGAIPLNLYPECIKEFERTLTAPEVHASVEGTSWKEQRGQNVIVKPGMQVKFSPDSMKKPVGVRDGGAGNYNL
jgi:hypothetical protein